jgi:hypothetical protein
MVRVIPDIPKIKAHWERRGDAMPYLMVPMSNGEIVRFNAEIPQPSFYDAMQNVRNMKEMCIGYERRTNESTL